MSPTRPTQCLKLYYIRSWTLVCELMTASKKYYYVHIIMMPSYFFSKLYLDETFILNFSVVRDFIIKCIS